MAVANGPGGTDPVYGLDRGGVPGCGVRVALAVDREEALLRYVGHRPGGVLRGIELFELALVAYGGIAEALSVAG
jgi:hypothetical protein